MGAVGYYLLTGHPIFEATSIVELCNLHVTAAPVPPSQKTSQPISNELEHAILSCLEKPLAKRPQTARDLSLLLARSPQAAAWSIEEADLWWSQHSREMQAESSKPISELTATQAESEDAAASSKNEGEGFDRTVIG